MKTLKVLSILFPLALPLCGQNLEVGSGFNVSAPVRSMSESMTNAFGLNFEAAKSFKAPFSLGLEFSFGSYGYQTSRQQYTFDDGSVTETDVNVSNNIFNLNLTGKHFLRNNKNINPYISGKAGWSWFSTVLTIEDPEDESSCHPLESDLLLRDNTYSVSAGAGVRIDFKTFFRRSETQRFFFDISVHAIHGGTLKYMNSEIDPREPMPDQDVMAKFLNTHTQVIHEHHVGYVYSSVLDMVEYRLGVIYRPVVLNRQQQ
jgi:hypothetical protein